MGPRALLALGLLAIAASFGMVLLELDEERARNALADVLLRRQRSDREAAEAKPS